MKYHKNKRYDSKWHYYLSGSLERYPWKVPLKYHWDALSGYHSGALFSWDAGSISAHMTTHLTAYEAFNHIQYSFQYVANFLAQTYPPCHQCLCNITDILWLTSCDKYENIFKNSESATTDNIRKEGTHVPDEEYMATMMHSTVHCMCVYTGYITAQKCLTFAIKSSNNLVHCLFSAVHVVWAYATHAK